MAYFLVPETILSDLYILVYFIFPATLQDGCDYSTPSPDEGSEAEARCGSARGRGRPGGRGSAGRAGEALLQNRVRNSKQRAWHTVHTRHTLTDWVFCQALRDTEELASCREGVWGRWRGEAFGASSGRLEEAEVTRAQVARKGFCTSPGEGVSAAAGRQAGPERESLARPGTSSEHSLQVTQSRRAHWVWAEERHDVL